MTSDALRKRREETSIEIRKQKRYNDLNKRRQMDLAPSDSVKEMERDNVRGDLLEILCTAMLDPLTLPFFDTLIYLVQNFTQT